MAVYVALEGAEGCGKSTQAARLAASLDAVLTRETGGTSIGARLREILHDVEVTDLDARAEALVVAGDRAQHLAEVVRPALASGRHVVSDRSIWSSLAYQGFGRGLPVDDVRRINDWAVTGRWPDLAVLLEVPDDVAAERLRARELDRFEREAPDFHARVVDGFRSLAAAHPDQWVVIDATGTADDVEAAVRAAVAHHLGV